MNKCYVLYPAVEILCQMIILFTRELSSLLTHWAEKNDFSLTLYPYSNGDDLLTALRTIPVDLIFLDIIMPLLNGIDTAREIRSMGLTVNRSSPLEYGYRVSEKSFFSAQ